MKNPLAQKSITEESFQYKILDYIICVFFFTKETILLRLYG